MLQDYISERQCLLTQNTRRINVIRDCRQMLRDANRQTDYTPIYEMIGEEYGATYRDYDVLAPLYTGTESRLNDAHLLKTTDTWQQLGDIIMLMRYNLSLNSSPSFKVDANHSAMRIQSTIYHLLGLLVECNLLWSLITTRYSNHLLTINTIVDTFYDEPIDTM